MVTPNISVEPSNEGLGEPAQRRRLARTFAARIRKVWMLMNNQT